MLSTLISLQPTRKYGNLHNVARFEGTPSISHSHLTKYNVDANRLRGIPV